MKRNEVVTIEGKAGEYTGFSNLTNYHYFSMYDGSVIKLSEEELDLAFPDRDKNEASELNSINETLVVVTYPDKKNQHVTTIAEIKERFKEEQPGWLSMFINSILETGAGFTRFGKYKRANPAFVVCPNCEGTGTWVCVAQLYDGEKFIPQPGVTMNCNVCNGAGVVDPVEQAKKKEEADAFWCDCKEDHGVTFFDDGEGTMCHKHHYVCNNCGKVQQVG